VSDSGLCIVGEPRAGRAGGWWRATMDGRPCGAMRLDPGLLAPPGGRDRAVAALSRLAGAAPAGVLPMLLVAPQDEHLWVVTADPAEPTVAALLRSGGLGLTPEVLLTVAYDIATAVHRLHGFGLAHGALDVDTAVVDPVTGATTLVEAGLLPASPTQDATALSGVLAALAAAAPGDTAGTLHQCAGAARYAGPSAVLGALAGSPATDPTSRSVVARAAAAVRAGDGPGPATPVALGLALITGRVRQPS
jgi:hypothetical protein